MIHFNLWHLHRVPIYVRGWELLPISGPIGDWKEFNTGFLATRVLPLAIGHSILRTSVNPRSREFDFSKRNKDRFQTNDPTTSRDEAMFLGQRFFRFSNTPAWIRRCFHPFWPFLSLLRWTGGGPLQLTTLAKNLDWAWSYNINIICTILMVLHAWDAMLYICVCERECFRVFQCARVCVCVRVHGIWLCLCLQNCADAQARICAGVCVCVCVCVSLCLSLSLPPSLRMHVCVCARARSSACVCVCVCVCMRVRVHVCVSVCPGLTVTAYVCACVCLCVNACVIASVNLRAVMRVRVNVCVKMFVALVLLYSASVWVCAFFLCIYRRMTSNCTMYLHNAVHIFENVHLGSTKIAKYK